MNDVQVSYPVGFTSNLGKKPMSVKLEGIHLVVFRGKKGIEAYEDRCPHRGAPLSAGRVEEGKIVCPYHGWTFGEGGECLKVPGIRSYKSRKGHCVRSFSARERYGLIWVGKGEIPEIPQWEKYDCFWMFNELEGTVANVMENALDPMHTLFVHKGWIRWGKPQELKVVITNEEEKAEAEYFTEQKQKGFIFRTLSLGREVTSSFGRVMGPNCFQLEYLTSKDDHLLITAFVQPVEEGKVRVYIANLFKTTFPKWLFMPLAKSLFQVALRQDEEILRKQHRNLQQFEKSRFVKAKTDCLRSSIEKILKREKMIPKRYEVILDV